MSDLLAKPIMKMGAIDLDMVTRLATGELKDALVEVQRLRGVCLDIIEVIDCSQKEDGAILADIAELAQGYFQP